MNREATKSSSTLGNTFAQATRSGQLSATATVKSSKAKTSPRITLRLSEEEYECLQSLSAGMTVSAYVRKCVFGENTTKRKRRSYCPVADQAALAKTLALLGETRIANNLNQLAHHANLGSLEVNEATVEKIEAAYQHVVAMRQTLIDALGLIDKS